MAPPFKEYLLTIVNSGVSAYYVLLTVGLVLFLCFGRQARAWYSGWTANDRRVLLLCALSFLVFLFGRNKDLRLVAPVLPVFALGIASLLDHALTTAGGKVRSIAAVLLLMPFPLLAFLHTSFGLLGTRQMTIGPLKFLAKELHFAGVYAPEVWPQGEILDRIWRVGRFVNGESRTVLLGSDLLEFNVNNFELEAVRRRLPLQIATSAYESDLNSLLARLRAASFFVYEEGGTAEAGPYNAHQKALLQEIRSGGAFAEVFPTFGLPDGGVAHVYRNVSLSSSYQEASFIRGAGKQADQHKTEPYQFDFGGQIQLTDAAVDQVEHALEISLRWRCLRPPDRDYMCFEHILDSHGNVVGQLDHLLLGGSPPLMSWRAGDVAQEKLRYVIVSPQKAEAYRVRLGLFDSATGDRLPVQFFLPTRASP